MKLIIGLGNPGFKNVAVRKRYYSNGEDAYLMIKELEG